MRAEDLRRAIEAVLLVAVEPVPPRLLAELLEQPLESVTEACELLALSYEREGRGFVLSKRAGGYRFQTHPDLAPYVERFANRDVSARLSAAALETLAIVAYRQPVSRVQMASLRGVNVDGVVKLLEQRGYIEAVGHGAGPGQPVLYGTTEVFLERLGLDSLEQLPAPEELLPTPEAAAELERSVQGRRAVAAAEPGAQDDENDGKAATADAGATAGAGGATREAGDKQPGAGDFPAAGPAARS